MHISWFFISIIINLLKLSEHIFAIGCGMHSQKAFNKQKFKELRIAPQNVGF